MKKLTQLLKESQHLDYRRMNVGEDEEGQGMTKEEKRAFVEAVAAYRQLGEMISHKGNISEIHDSIKGIVENANNLTLKETGDWFDRVTVQRHMKSMNESFKVFSNTIKEVSTLQQRLESSYDEIGEVLGKYYEIKEGNEFGAERAKAIAAGKDSFEVDGKSFKVTGVDAEDKENAEKFANESMKLTSLLKREELKGDQHKIDVDDDGEIEASDLAALRAGKKKDESVNEGVKLSLVDPTKNKFVKTLSLDRTYREAEKEVETLNRRLSPSEKAKGFYWKVSSINESVNEEEIKWNAVENAIINFLKMNTKILDKRVKDRDTDGVKNGLKSIISGLTNAQRNLKLESVNEVFSDNKNLNYIMKGRKVTNVAYDSDFGFAVILDNGKYVLFNAHSARPGQSKDMEFESVNEITFAQGLKALLKGNTSSVEGIKVSPELANAIASWSTNSIWGQRYGSQLMKAPFANAWKMIFSSAYGVESHLKRFDKATLAKVKPELAKIQAKLGM
jgi:hypothetical protein